ncbi:MAG: hypothetical protein WCR13_08040, partial [Sphaerochaeta sp.]
MTKHGEAAKVIADRRPICIAKEGLNVLDDCGNVSGYIDMLRTIHEVWLKRECISSVFSNVIKIHTLSQP